MELSHLQVQAGDREAEGVSLEQEVGMKTLEDGQSQESVWELKRPSDMPKQGQRGASCCAEPPEGEEDADSLWCLHRHCLCSFTTVRLILCCSEMAVELIPGLCTASMN